MSVLNQICTEKLDHIKRMKAEKSLSSLESEFQENQSSQGFIKTIKEFASNKRPALIAEVKKASPSRGVIRADFHPAQIANSYAGAGAACLSVLTDTPYFQGSDDDLRAVRRAVSIPVLRKDFMLDPYQIAETRALGADCALLIIAALSDAQAEELFACAGDYGLDVLVEVHDAHELERAMRLSPSMIGVNNRSLKTLHVDIQTGKDLAASIPESCIKVAESGITTRDDILDFQSLGYDAFLVGESLMKQDNIANAVKNLLPEIDTKQEQR